jgi:hypothetical protein
LWAFKDFSVAKIRFATDSKALATMSKVSLAGWVVSPERVFSIVQTSGEAPIPRASSGQAYPLERGGSRLLRAVELRQATATSLGELSVRVGSLGN